MAKRPRSKKSENNLPDNLSSLLNALKFVSTASNDIGPDYQCHALLGHGGVVATNGLISAGAPVDVDILAAPHTGRLVAALSRCKGPVAITHHDNGSLSIRSEGFLAYVPCVPLDNMVNMVPDPQIGVLSPAVFDALRTVGVLAQENSQQMATATVLLQSGSAIATNGMIAMEYWHGVGFPSSILLPKASVQAILKQDKEAVGFGKTDKTFTIHYADGSWLKTQVYNQPYPDKIFTLFDRIPQTLPEVPKELWEAVKTVAPFCSEMNAVYLGKGIVRTHTEETGATCEVPGLNGDAWFSHKLLDHLAPVVTRFDIIGAGGISPFYGDNLRGVIAQIVKRS